MQDRPARECDTFAADRRPREIPRTACRGCTSDRPPFNQECRDRPALIGRRDIWTEVGKERAAAAYPWCVRGNRTPSDGQGSALLRMAQDYRAETDFRDRALRICAVGRRYRGPI